MKQTCFACLSLLLFLMTSMCYGQKTRLVILADMGNEPDEEQQMMHLLMYANEVELEGLIAVTGKFLNPNSSRTEKQRLYPELFHHLIEGYGLVVDNLKSHADGWPDPDYLHGIVTSGQRGYGMSGVGEGLSSEGSDWLKEVMLRTDDRSIYIVVNAGSNTLAQALLELRAELSEDDMTYLISKLRVFENGAQDDAGAWICHHFPEIHWIRSNYQTYCYGGPGVDGSKNNQGDSRELGPHLWQPYSYSGIGQHQWLLENVIGNHGPFGAYYPLRQFRRGGISFMEGGGTIPWLGLVRPGLSSIDHPEWGGWSGRYTSTKEKNVWSKHASVEVDEAESAPFYMFNDTSDRWIDPRSGEGYDHIFAPVFRWREAFYQDFQCRMDWCVASFEEANHHPVAIVGEDDTDSIIVVMARVGESLSFDAGHSRDPDGDELNISWWVYPEAGTYPGDLHLPASTGSSITFSIPEDAVGTTIHLILEVEDRHPIAHMFDYRRVILQIAP